MTEPLRSVLIVDDELSIRESLRMVLKHDYQCLAAENGQQALQLFETKAPDLVLLDVLMPGMDGITLLGRLRAIDPEAIVIMLTAVTNIRDVVRAMKEGAEDYLSKPFDVGEVKLVIDKALDKTRMRRELERLRSEVSERYGYASIVGKSKPMRAVYEIIQRVASKQTTVLLRGESGTGKELVARAIHYSGSRRNGPFVSVNCAAIPDSLFESEMFGHERGAFTDAHQRKIGHFEQADGGTILLDEVGELSPLAQSKLLRVLQEREFLRVGGSSPLRVDVRVVAATNSDLEQAVADRGFRRDLYYRLNVVNPLLPSLRERMEDIPLLVEHFLTRHAEEGRKPRLGPGAMEALMAHDWPGNVRELENSIERALALAPEDTLHADDLSRAIYKVGPAARLRSEVLSGQLGFETAVETFERDLLGIALDRTGWVQTRAARLLGLSRRVLKYKMDKYELERPED